jgi:glutaredoxin 3
MARLELFGTGGCPYTQEMREWLEWRGCDFVEYDVEQDRAAFARLYELSGGQRVVPVLMEDGKLIQSGWQGRGCIADGNPHA